MPTTPADVAAILGRLMDRAYIHEESALIETAIRAGLIWRCPCKATNDLDAGHTDVTAQWEGELLRFAWSEDHDGVAGQHLVLPDEHDRYPIGGLWTWVPWNDPIAQRPAQQAYAVGASEYTSPVTTEFDGDLFLDYLRGRVEASRLTLHRNEP